MVVTDSADEAVVFGNKAEFETMELGEVVPLGLESEPLLPSSDEDGTNADDAPVPVGPTTTELMLNVGKGAP
jgi:hypothetical protein